MTLSIIAAAELNRDNLSTEISANAGQRKVTYVVPTGYAGTVIPTGYAGTVIPTG